jgi:predicted aminopeptidase
MMVRGIRVSQWLKQRSVQRLVRRVFPGTRVRVRNRREEGRRAYDFWWSGPVANADMRALADEIEAALPAKAQAAIECRRIP